MTATDGDAVTDTGARRSATAAPALTESTPPTALLAHEVAAPVDVVPAPAPDSEPFLPQTPAPSPAAPTSTVGGAGCSTQGAGPGNQKAGAAAAAGVLGSPVEISLSVNEGDVASPAAGSPTLSATDPATRPD